MWQKLIVFFFGIRVVSLFFDISLHNPNICLRISKFSLWKTLIIITVYKLIKSKSNHLIDMANDLRGQNRIFENIKTCCYRV